MIINKQIELYRIVKIVNNRQILGISDRTNNFIVFRKLIDIFIFTSNYENVNVVIFFLSTMLARNYSIFRTFFRLFRI